MSPCPPPPPPTPRSLYILFIVGCVIYQFSVYCIDKQRFSLNLWQHQFCTIFSQTF